MALWAGCLIAFSFLNKPQVHTKKLDAEQQQRRTRLFAIAVVCALVLVIVASAVACSNTATVAPLDADNLSELEQLTPEGEGWTSGLASAYSLETNDGWDETASGIPLDTTTPTVAVPQDQSDLLGSTVEIFYAGMTVEAQVTDTGAFGELGRALDLSPAVRSAFGADSLDEWGVRTVWYRFI